MREPKANAVLVEALSRGIRSTGNGLADVPSLLKRVLLEGAWKQFVTPRGELVRHDQFIDFVTTPATAGLGANIDVVRRIVSADPEATDLLDQALQNRHGGDRRSGDAIKLDNIQLDPAPSGTSREAGLRRLRKDAPELHAEVLAGRLSAHAAMVRAGFRRKTVSVPVDRPEAVAKTLRKNLTRQDIRTLVKLLDPASDT